MAGEFIKAKGNLKIGQRVEFYLENDDTRYASRIEDIVEDKVVVAMPMNSKHVPLIPRQGEKLYALAVGDRCRLRFFSKFIAINKLDDRIPVWHIKLPETVERHQNREFVRIRVSLPVKVKLIDSEGTIHAPKMSSIVNLSGNGICFVWPEALATGTRAGLEIHDIPGTGAIDLMSKVVRCTPIMQDDEIKTYHVGAVFKDMSRATSNKIVHYLFAVQRSSIAKGIDLQCY